MHNHFLSKRSSFIALTACWKIHEWADWRWASNNWTKREINACVASGEQILWTDVTVVDRCNAEECEADGEDKEKDGSHVDVDVVSVFY